MTNPTHSLKAADILDFPLTGTHLIEASAGTGKTYTIASLFAHYVLEGIGSDEILVVTFTNAATEELHARVRARLAQSLLCLESLEAGQDAFLEAMLRKYSGPDRKQIAIDRLQLAIRTLDEAAIFTIHGFCQRVLTDHAFNSGEDYETELVPDESEIRDQVLQDWWRTVAYPRNQEALNLLIAALDSLQTFQARLAPLCTIHAPALVPEVSESLEELDRAWLDLKPDLQKLACEWNGRAPQIARILEESKALSTGKDCPYHGTRLSEMLARVHDYFANEDPILDRDIIDFLSVSSLDKYSTPAKRGKDPQLRDPFFMACEDLRARIESITERFRIRALKEACEFVRERLEATKRRARLMSYDDQLTRLYAALNGPQAADLAENLRKNFPVAMIDEFQDTDAIQYGIFRAIYDPASTAALNLIGDPKQSIYRFRGSDLFTYLKAKRDAEKSYTLDTNWRSTPELIQALNSIFAFRDQAFVEHEAIGFSPVHAPDSEQRPIKGPDFSGEVPFTIWKIPLDEKGKPHGKTQATQLVATATAAEIRRLLRAPRVPKIEARDIAVLVRDRHEGEDIKNALARHGIQSASITRANIHHSEEARGLRLLLAAVAESGSQQVMRNALASDLLDLGYPEIDRIWGDEERWQDWSESLKVLNEIWRQKGFMVMFQHLMDRREIGERIAKRDNAERRLTNLMQLAEILQEASKQHAQPTSLLAWFDRQARETLRQENELRLESEEDLVRIVTIHSSKGLEYPIVFVPFAWGAKPVETKDKQPIAYRDASGKAWLDLGSNAQLRNKAHCLAEKERIGEELRLLYVALTRARSKVYLAWGRVNHSKQDLSGKSAMAYLLHSRQSAEDLETALPSAFSGNCDLDRDLDRLVQMSAGTIEVRELPDAQEFPAEKISGLSHSPIEVREFKGQIATDWRIASFTGLTRDVHQVAHGGSPRSEDDAILNFPAGSRTGLFLHRILEDFDFQGSVEFQAQELWRRFAPQFNFISSANTELLACWLNHIVNARLNDQDLRLKDLCLAQRLNELEFDFSLERADIAALNRLCESLSKRSLEALEAEDFRGLVNGVIDLVFVHDGRYYIADYKSNYLGGALSDYGSERLADAIVDRRYDVQYLIYTLAVHRYLQQRVPGYDYARHFGGVYYLFLRAMRQQNPRGFGIFAVRPEVSVIDALEGSIFARSR